MNFFFIKIPLSIINVKYTNDDPTQGIEGLTIDGTMTFMP